MTRIVFAAAAFLASALLFLIEPMVAKMILPQLGGSPAVWNTAMVFFQAVLLLGYAFAHASINRIGARLQPLVQLLLLVLVLAFLPVTLPAGWDPSGRIGPMFVFALLAVSIGLPFFALSTMSPILQHWYAAATGGSDPYFLYAVGNAGSLIGLLSYPIVVERLLAVPEQTLLWTIGYVFFLLSVGAAGWSVLRRRPNETLRPATHSGALPWRTQVRWIALAFIPSSLLLGSTAFITAEVGSIPLLWVLPLAVYLITFIVAFARQDRPSAAVGAAILKPTAIAVLVTWALHLQEPFWALVALHLLLLFAVGLTAHGRLYEQRPPAGDLTRFYLLISLGGVLGGLFNALAAPLLFVVPIEYPLVLVLALLVRKGAVDNRPLLARYALSLSVPLVVGGFTLIMNSIGLGGRASVALTLFVPGILLLAIRYPPAFALAFAFLLLVRPPVSGNEIFLARTFFGQHRVTEADGVRILLNGLTVHGTQQLGEASREPTAYYNRAGPLGDVMRNLPDNGRVLIIGLGAGSIAAYAQPGSEFTFVEIDPKVVEIATNPDLFTYLSQAAGTIHVITNDGRLAAEQLPTRRYDLVILDAFTADSVPVHLLTREAVHTYARLLSPSGLIAVNVTNRNFELEPVVGSLARSLGLTAATREDDSPATPAATASQWVVLAAGNNPLAGEAGWREPVYDPGVRAWTDDYSNLVSVLR